MCSKGGRPAAVSRLEFDTIEENGKIVGMRCKGCKSLVSNKADRLRKHLTKCKENPPKKAKVQSQKRMTMSSESDDIDTDHTESTMSITPSTPVLVKERCLQAKLDSFVLKTTQVAKKELDLKVARMFYANSIPFRIADSKFFKEAISALRPSYVPPTRLDIGNRLLDSVYEEEQRSAKHMLEGQTVTLMQDGWSNIHNGPIIAHCIQTGKNVLYLNAIDTGSNKKSAAYCTGLAREAIELAEEQYGCKVRAVVTDNESKMRKMRQNFEEDGIMTYGCAAHYLNLLGQDIEQSMSSIMKHVTDVQKFFRNHHQAGGFLKECPGAVKPQIPGDTRWNSNNVCLETFLKNRPHYLEIVANHEPDIEQRIVATLNNYGLYKEAKSLLQQFKPVAQAIDTLQSDCATIADACEVWMDLLNNEELIQHKKKVEERINQALTPAHYLANILHPKYQGAKVNFDQENKAADWLAATNDPEFAVYILSFKSQNEPFPKTLFHPTVVEKTKPSTWWKSLKKAPIDPKFIQFVSELMSYPASSAGLERIFSNFSFVHTKIRNRLGVEKTSKLVYCYRMLNKGKFPVSDW